MIKKIGVLTSGGDSPGMNATIRAVTRSALKKGMQVYGIYDGYSGLVEGDIEELDRSSVSDILFRGGTILGSARLPEFADIKVREKGIENLKKYGIDALVVIGGDGTYRGALELTKMGINCIALPGTIDNDIVGTEFTIGFDTALNTIIEAIDKLRDTSASHHRCSVVEVMGNKCGDLALYASIACGAEIVITPESEFDEEEVLEKLRHIDEERKKKRHAIVVISEKMTDVEVLASKISESTGFSGRSTVLGHVQRGGSPTASDRLLATKLGDEAVELLSKGLGGYCVGLIDNRVKSILIEEALSLPKTSRKALYELQKRMV